MNRFWVLQTTYGDRGVMEVQRRGAPSYADLLREIARLRALLSERDAEMAGGETRMESLKLLNKAIQSEHDEIRRIHVEFVIKHRNTVNEITLYHEYFVNLYKQQVQEEKGVSRLLHERVAREHQLAVRFSGALQHIAEEAGCDKHECGICCETVYTINTECNHRFCAECFASWHHARNCNDCDMNCPMCRLPVK